jgi:hypothetical protein
LFAFFIITILYITIILSIEYFSINYIKKNRISQYQTLQEYGKEKTISLLGTSHTNYANIINQNNFLNYGQSGTFFVEMFYKTKKLIRYAENLKILVVEVDDLQFSNNAKVRRDKNYNYLKSINKVSSDYIYSNNKDVRPIIHKELLKFILGKPIKIKESRKGVSLVEINNKIYYYQNWKDKVKDSEKKIQTINRLKEYHLNYMYEVPTILKKYLEDTIELAQKNNIKVIFIRHPQSKEYWKYMNKEKQKDTNTYIQTLSKKYLIKILDYRYIFQTKQDLFYNQDHLNTEGWKVLIPIFLKDINNEL